MAGDITNNDPDRRTESHAAELRLAYWAADRLSGRQPSMKKGAAIVRDAQQQ
jgi:hypothetical protein